MTVGWKKKACKKDQHSRSKEDVKENEKDRRIKRGERGQKAKIRGRRSITGALKVKEHYP